MPNQEFVSDAILHFADLWNPVVQNSHLVCVFIKPAGGITLLVSNSPVKSVLKTSSTSQPYQIKPVAFKETFVVKSGISISTA